MAGQLLQSGATGIVGSAATKDIRNAGPHAGQRVTIMYVWGDAEAEQFAREIKSAFDVSGWVVPHLVRSTFSESPTGLHVAVRDSKHPPAMAPIVLEALEGAGLPVQGSQKNDVPAEATYIIVGSKRQ